MRLLAWSLVPCSCEWVSDDRLRERLDDDLDGTPVTEDCNDRDPGVSILLTTDELSCGDVLEAEIGGPDLLRIANCIHPLVPDTLVHYGRQEDVRVFAPAEPTEAVVTFRALDGFVQSDPAAPREPGFDLGGIALFAWRGARCARDACELGLPVASKGMLAGTRPWSASATLEGAAGREWYLVVTGDAGSRYELSVECP